MLLGASGTAWTALALAAFLLFFVVMLSPLEASARWRPFPILTALRRRAGAEAFWAATWMLLAVGISHAWGGRDAQARQRFYLLGAQPPHIVLSMYGDRVICAPFDRIENTVTARFSVLKVGESSTPDLVLTTIGPLRPVAPPFPFSPATRPVPATAPSGQASAHSP